MNAERGEPGHTPARKALRAAFWIAALLLGGFVVVGLWVAFNSLAYL
ncbi:MAG: hypothetical protein V3U59_06400 [Gammaproteobacteria bacterium]